MRATVASLARRAGVAASTVSRALRNDSRILPEAQARVAALAAETGYLPKALARALTSGRSDLTGLANCQHLVSLTLAQREIPASVALQLPWCTDGLVTKKVTVEFDCMAAIQCLQFPAWICIVMMCHRCRRQE